MSALTAPAARKRLKWKASLADLYRVPENGKAELVDGKLVLVSPTGFLPGRASLAIAASLREYERKTGYGFAIGDNVGFVVRLPRRRSFSPDAAFHVGEPTGGKFLEGAPIFAAGTRIVWDVDVLREKVVRVYDARRPGEPRVYRRGERAKAEPALPGWWMPVDDLFEGSGWRKPRGSPRTRRTPSPARNARSAPRRAA